MAIRLCQACLHEIQEGDKRCGNCNVSVNRHATVIEVMSEYEGYSYVSNRYAYHDENLNNFNPELFKDNKKNSRLYPNNIQNKRNKTEDEGQYNIKEDSDFVKNFVKMIKNPNFYLDVILGILGAIVLIVGNLSAIYNNYISFGANSNSYFNYISTLIFAIALTAILLVVKHKKKYVLIPALVCATFLTFVMSEKDSIKYLGVGYYVMWVAVVMLIVSAVISVKSRVKKNFLIKADLTWILLTFFISLGLANTLSYNVSAKTKTKEEQKEIINTTTINIPTEEVQMFKLKDEKVNVDVSLLDSYLVRNEEDDMIVVELSVYNNASKKINVKDYLDVFVVQDDIEIMCSKDIKNIKFFDMKNRDGIVKAKECGIFFFGFNVKEKGDVYLNIVNKKLNKTLMNQILTLNSKFYVSNKVSTLPDGDSDMVKKAEENKGEVWNIYFTKPKNWSEDVYAYIYYINKNGKVKELEEWPGKKMENHNGAFNISYDKKWFNRARVIIVDKNNQNNRFPKNSSSGLLLQGNINITPRE